MIDNLSLFIKFRSHRGLESNCFFWRDKAGHEIDCLLDFGDRLIPVEIKSGETITSGFLEGLNYWNRIDEADPCQSLLIYAGARREERSQARVLGRDKAWEVLNV